MKAGPVFAAVLASLLALGLAFAKAPPATLDASQRIAFPKGFWWGTSLSGHQSEGGIVDSWTAWENGAGHIQNGDRSGAADDEWNRYDEDFENLRWLNANTHRLSIEWSRLEPKPGDWDAQAAAHYREMLIDLRSKGIRPVVCLFHSALPQWVADEGGFENPAMVDAFVDFARHAVADFGDIVTDWFTMNEPNLYALGGYETGQTPPGVSDNSRTAKVIVNLIEAHARAYHAIKELEPQARVSFAHHMTDFQPASGLSPLDRFAAASADTIGNWIWLDAIRDGRIELHIPFTFDVDVPCPECKGALDYIAINYYTREILKLNLFSKNKVTEVPGDGPKSDTGMEIYPQGLVDLLGQLKKRGYGSYPILISENGLADRDDKYRAQFIYDHVKAFLETCQQLGLTPMGYLHWSLIDNFEWNQGFSPRFGLFSVDYATQKRTPRGSAYYFREIGAERALVPPAAASF